MRDDAVDPEAAITNGRPVLTDAELASKKVLDPVAISYLPPKKYPTGTPTFEHTFPETGKFIGIVTVQNEHGQIYPFEVGTPLGRSIALYGMTGAGLIAA